MTEARVCVRCKEVKDIDQFGNSKQSKDGKRRECKQCSCTMAKEWRVHNRDRVIDSCKLWRTANKEKVAAYKKEYNATHKEEINAYRRKDYIKRSDAIQEQNRKYRAAHRKEVYARKDQYRQREIVKFNAHCALQNALRRGKLVKINKCVNCEASPTQAHHPDYSKPLDVIWLCCSCHAAVHRKYGKVALYTETQGNYNENRNTYNSME